jgi:hypothetical protein
MLSGATGTGSREENLQNKCRMAAGGSSAEGHTNKQARQQKGRRVAGLFAM